MRPLPPPSRRISTFLMRDISAIRSFVLVSELGRIDWTPIFEGGEIVSLFTSLMAIFDRLALSLKYASGLLVPWLNTYIVIRMLKAPRVI